MKPKTKLKKPRNKIAVSAHNRKSSKIVKKPRGGAKNKQADILKNE